MLILYFFIPFLGFSQIFEGRWSVDYIIGHHIDNKEINLIKGDRNYGNFILFNEDNTFYSYYSAPCGNDCFRSSEGTYKVMDSLYIHFSVTKIYQIGYCDNFEKTINQNFGNYLITKVSENKIKLTQSKGNKIQDMEEVKHSVLLDKFIERMNEDYEFIRNFPYDYSAKTEYEILTSNEMMEKDNISRVKDYVENKLNLKNYKLIGNKIYFNKYINLVQLDSGDYLYIVNNMEKYPKNNIGYCDVEE